VAQAAPTLCKHLLASRNLFEEMAQAADNEFQLEKGGLMVICRTAQRLEEERGVAAQGRALGLGVEELRPEQASALQGGLQMDIAGALLYTDDWWLTPQLHLAWLRRELSRLGAQFQWNAEVTGWETAGEGIKSVRTTRGDFSADEYIVACGSWTPKVVKPLGLRLLIQAGKGYNLTLPAPRRKVPISSVLAEGRVAVTQMGETLRFAGTMEMSGLDNSVNPRRIVGIMKSVSKFFPEFTAGDFWDIPAWNGLRPVTPDGLAYIGRFSRYQNLSVGAGHAMLGLSLGPITGRLLAEIICGETPSLPLEAFSPDRYA
jgi:D-amino-acid dehydrogenase